MSALLAQTVDDAARDLAFRASSWVPSRSSITVRCSNRTGARDSEFGAACRAFTRELQRLGLQVNTAGPSIELSESQSRTGRLLIARLDPSTGTHVAVAAWTPPSTGAPPIPHIRLERTVLLESPSPVLDFLVRNEPNSISVLEPSGVAFYAKSGNTWQLAKMESLPLSKPAPRDPRGRLLTGTDALTAYLPGSVCTTDSAATRPFSCTSADGAMPFRWIPGRNTMQGDSGPVFTIAPVNPDASIVAGTDGALKLVSKRGDPGSTASGFGSDIAVVETPCGAMAIATHAADRTEPDELVALAVRNGRLETLGVSIAVAGPVTALWPANSPAEMNLVVKNLSTGLYEASRLAIACLQ